MDSIYEVSYTYCLGLQLHVENYIDEDRSECSDPFEIVAEKEEEQGRPLASSF